MGERLDRALALLERAVVALERIAERDAKPTKPPQRKPPRVSEADREAAKRVARRMGLVVREGNGR